MTTATVVTVDQPLRLHVSPSLTSDVIDGMDPQSVVDVLGPAVGDFLPVSFNGETGFAAVADPSTGEQLLKINGLAGLGMLAKVGIAVGVLVAGAAVWMLVKK